ncbi:GNAT family protein [Nesterenkonia rhizosphaerae]|uniref:GNAT family protein n=1 Tax=Nesterenkonia rhizosphaerae TaxID=1348272 RepID=A0ABP9FXL9_9MICC
MSAAQLPPWPPAPPRWGSVLLRQVQEKDVPMAQEMSADAYIPQIGSLPPHADHRQAREWVQRQQTRHEQGIGFSFTIADAGSDEPVGHCGLWLKEISAGRGSAGYAIRPSARGRGLAAEALLALTSFGWDIPLLHRIELYIEPWNTGSIRTAEQAGYAREGVLRSHQEIGGVRRDMLLFAAVRP